MNNYAESTDKTTGRKSYIRTSSRNGEAVTLENISLSGDIAKALKFAVWNSSMSSLLMLKINHIKGIDYLYNFVELNSKSLKYSYILYRFE